MRSIYKYILFLYLLLTTLPELYASQETFRSLSVPDGMTDLVVNTIYKDSRGFIWFGTNSSMEKFDGVRLKKYELDVSDNNKKRVYTITESPYYGMLCGTGGGICRLDTLRGVFVPFFQNEITAKVNSLLCYASDTLLIATDEGLYTCNSEGIQKKLVGNNPFAPENKLTGITFSKDSMSVWLSTMDGITWYKPSTNEYKRFVCKKTDLSNSFYNIAAIGDYLYLGTMDRGLMRFDIRNSEFSSYVDVGCSVISSLSSDGKDLLYVGTDGNGVHFVYVKRHEVVKSYRHIPGKKEGIRSNSVYSVLVDRDGLLWIGLYQIGVDYSLYQSGLFGIYKWKDKFTTKDMPVRTIAFNGNQRLIGSRDGLVFIDEGRDIVKSFNVPVLRANMIISSCYHEGKFYVGTYGGGMYVLNPENLSISDFPEKTEETFRSGHIFSIHPDHEGNLWIGTSAGLYCFNNGKMVYHFVSSHSKIPEGNVYEIFFDSTGNGWICTETGVCMWDHSMGAIRNDVFPEGSVNNEKVRAVYESSSHELYFLPEKGKAFRTNLLMDRFSFLDEIPIFNDKQLLSIVEDGIGGMFVTSNNGLYRIDSCKNVIPYNFTDGIPDPIFTNCSSVKDSSDVFWFGNSKGLVCLEAGNINSLRKHPYKIEITDILVNGKAPEFPIVRGKDNTYKLEIDHSNHNLRILFSGMIYSDPSYMIYEYSIDSESWKPLHGVSEISLYDVNDNKVLKIRRAGYPDSQAMLYINVASNGFLLMLITIFVVLLLVLIYVFRKRVIECTVGNLKKFIIWLQPSEKKVDEIVSGNDWNVSENKTDNTCEDNIDDSDYQIDNSEDKYRNYKLSDEECKRLIKILDREMSKNKLYMNQSLKIADLAAVANTSSHALSYVFNQFLQKSYYDYINEYRVEEFKSAIQKEKYSKYTLEALSEHCGFSSRASFFRSFKKVTGITPNEYIKNIKMSGKDNK